MHRSGSDSGSPAVGGRTPEMTLYDKHRKPHKLITDSTEIVISPRSLDSELMCPICLDMLTTTMTTKECLHRFCSECITTALRNGNKECPTCRKKLVSKRSLRPDPNFDALINKIYPNREEYEAMQQRAFAKLTQHSSSKAFQDSMEEGIKYQAQLRKMRKLDPRDFEYKKRVRKPKAAADASAEDGDDPHDNRESSLEPSASEASASAGGGTMGAVEVELILRPHPALDANPSLTSPLRTTRYLKTTGNATVDHIAEYVGLRVRLDTEESQRLAEGAAQLTAATNATSSFRIFVNPGIGSNKPFTLLDGGLTLSEVRNRYWKVKRPLELQFHLREESPANQNPQPSPLPTVQTGLFGSSGIL